jgi:MFS family permease
MCAFNFTVFLSAFQLFPTAPYRIQELGGGTAAAGLFLGFLTYGSAFSAPFTGALADRVGRARMLVACALALAVFFTAYAFMPRYEGMLALVLLHGVFWSGLLSASAAQVADLLPESRRAEGLGYWGFSTILAIAVAPAIGFKIHKVSWTLLCAEGAFLNVAMALATGWLTRGGARAHRGDGPLVQIEWRVVAISVTLFLYSFGYGAVTSFVALYTDASHTTPRSLYFTTFSLTTIAVRLISGPLADRIGHRRVFMPCLLLIVAGYLLLAAGGTRFWLIASGIVFGTGFGAAWPVFTAHLLRHFDPTRRGAVFGGVLACFDTGIGTGSIVSGWIISRWGFHAAYLVAAALASCSLPYFLAVEKRVLPGAWDGPPATANA